MGGNAGMQIHKKITKKKGQENKREKIIYFYIVIFWQ